MDQNTLKVRIEQFQHDMRSRVEEEFILLKSPSEVDLFLKNLRWENPELAMYAKREFDIMRKH
ncbi:MAG: hypothetical protein LUG90_21485 [Clostridiaceae bacterium]|nr:hypothetical protein [Clostridiaceae bacterium]